MLLRLRTLHSLRLFDDTLRKANRRFVDSGGPYCATIAKTFWQKDFNAFRRLQRTLTRYDCYEFLTLRWSKRHQRVIKITKDLNTLRVLRVLNVAKVKKTSTRFEIQKDLNTLLFAWRFVEKKVLWIDSFGNWTFTYYHSLLGSYCNYHISHF